MKDSNMKLNIEMKGPQSEKWQSKYDFDLCCVKVNDLIQQFDIGHRTIISSFRHQITDQMQKSSNSTYKVLQLYNDWERHDDNYETPPGCHGVNLDIEYLEQALIDET